VKGKHMIKTAICKDSQGNVVPVQCKVWSNGQTTCLKRTRQQLKENHPSLMFDSWVLDLSDEQAKALPFLSPNVEFVLRWAFTSNGIEYGKLHRDGYFETLN
jgi:hypothetical protein